MKELNDTAHKLLDAAEQKTQVLGFNAFSYKDLQLEVGVKTSSIHYYFPSKQDLAFAMIERYVDRFRTILTNIAAENPKGMKRLYVLGHIYIEAEKQGKFCMCGMLASDLMSLPDHAKIKLQEFFTLNEVWIAEAIDLAKQQKDFKDSLDGKKSALLFCAVLEGAMLIARTQKHGGYLEAAIQQAIDQMKD